MTWLAAHPDNTVKERTPDVEGAPVFEFGFWPPRVAEKISVSMASMRKVSTDEDLQDPRGESFIKTLNLNFDLVVEMVRFGVRGWEGGGLTPAVSVDERVDALVHKVLDPSSINLLSANGLLNVLSQKCWMFNVLTEEKKKESGLRLVLGTSTNLTDAPSVPPDNQNPEGSSV